MAVKFRPVRGTESQIEMQQISDGYIYFATDSGHIYVDKDGERITMGGAGIAWYYAYQAEVAQDDNDNYIIPASAVDTDQIVKIDDLLINTDGAFYKVLSYSNDNYLCSQIAVSGSGGGGGGPVIEDDLTLSIDSSTIDRGMTFIQGQNYYISVTGTSTIDSQVSLFFQFTGENGYSAQRNITSPSGEPCLLNINFLPANENIKMVVEVSSDNTKMVRMPSRSVSNLRVVSMGIKKSNIMNTVCAGILTDSASVSYGLTGGLYKNDQGVITSLEETLHVYIDGIEDTTLQESVRVTSSEKTVVIPPQQHGSHTIGLQVSTEINDITMYSNMITYELAWAESYSTVPVIWTAEYESQVIQYEPFEIKYQVYDPIMSGNGRDDYFTVYIYKQGALLSEISRKYTPGQWLTLDLTENYEVGNNTYTIACGSTSKNISFYVTTEGSRDLGLVHTNSLIMNLSATGRSNDEIAVNRPVWAYNNYVATFNDFNWYSNGWKNDNDAMGSYLSVTNGANVEIPFMNYSGNMPTPFTFNDGLTNYTIELRFRVRNIQEYSTLVTTIPYYYVLVDGVQQQNGMSIYEIKERQANNEDVVIVTDEDGYWKMDTKNTETLTKTTEGVCFKILGEDPAYGLCIGTQEAYFRSPEGTTSVRYKEDEIINFSVVVSSSEKLASIYLNGILSGSLQLGADSSFNIGNKIIINSDYCDIDIYKIRFYRYGLTMPEVIHNYISDIHNITLYDQNQLTKQDDATLLSYSKLVAYNEQMLEEGNIDALTMPYAVIEIIDNDTSMVTPTGAQPPTSDDRLPWKKGNNRYSKITFVNPSLDAAYNAGLIDEAYYETHSPSYVCIGADINVQGTSSQGYPRRNFKTKMKSAVSKVDYRGADKGGSHDDWGWFYTNEKFIEAKGGKASFKKWKQDNPVYGTNKFTWKIDYMESSGSYNTGFANLMGNNIYTAHPLAYYHIPGFSDNGLRTSVYGFPVLTFHKHSTPADKAKIGTDLEDEIYEYIGRYNLNQDKGSDELYGFSLDIEQPYINIEDPDTGEITHPSVADVAECWEMTDNQGTWTSFAYPSDVDVEKPFRTYTADSYDSNGHLIENPRLEVIRHYECRYHKDGDFIEAIASDEKPYDLATVQKNIEDVTVDEDEKAIWQSIDTIPKMNRYIVDKWDNWQKFVTWCDSTDRRKADPTRDLPEPVTYTLSTATELYGKDQTGVTINTVGEDTLATFTKDTATYRLMKFKHEFSKHLNLEYCTVYFVMTELLLCYDSRGKNMMMASYGPTEVGGEYIWFPIFYDIDTQLGLNNIGATLWDYDTDATLEQSFSTPSSVLWVNFFDCFEENIKNKYAALRGNNVLSYESIDGAYLCDPTVFDSYAMKGLRPMIAIGLDEYYKYVAPSKTGYYNTDGNLVYDNNSYAYAVNGDRMLSRELLLRNRLNYLDSYWVAGSYTPAAIAQGGVRMRANANNMDTSDKYLDSNSLSTLPDNIWQGEELAAYPVPYYDATPEFEITPFLNQYVFTYNDKQPSGEPIKYRGIPVKTTCSASVVDGYKKTPGFPEQIIIVPAEDYISSLGDLSLKYLSQFTLLNGKRILDLNIGSDAPDYFNNLLGVGTGQFNINDAKYITTGGQSFLNPSRKTLLKSINLTNVTELHEYIDMSGSEKLKECRALGTKITYIVFAEGAPLDTIHLPKTVSRLDLVEARDLTRILTTKPVVFGQDRDTYTGLYIEGVTDLTNSTDVSKVAFNRLNLVGGALGYDSYKLLTNALELVDRKAATGTRLRINLENVEWSPYKVVEPNTPYNANETYYYLTDHSTFTRYTFVNADEWTNLTLNERIFTYVPNEDSTLITSLSVLDKFIADYEEAKASITQTSHYTNLTNLLGYPNLTGSIYVSNENGTAIEEADITDKYGKIWDKLKIYAANVNEAYIAKFVQRLDNGKDNEIETIRYTKSGTVHPTMTSKIPIKQNYDFRGWTLNADYASRSLSNQEVTTLIQNGEVFDKNDLTTLTNTLTFDAEHDVYTFYAVFSITSFNIRYWNYNQNSAIDTPLYTDVVNYGTALSNPPILPSVDESELPRNRRYTFVGWVLDPTDWLAPNRTKAKTVALTNIISQNTDRDFYACYVEEDVHDYPTDSSFFYFQPQYTNGIVTEYFVCAGQGMTLSGKITIPKEYKGPNDSVAKPVTQIYDFLNNSGTHITKDITHIFFEPGSVITSIQSSTFQALNKLEYFEVPASLRIVGENAFREAGLKVFDIPADSNLKEIYGSAFWKTTSLEYFDLPEGLTELRANAMNQAFKVQDVTRIYIPGSLSWLYDSAYSYTPLRGGKIQIGSKGHPTQFDFEALRMTYSNPEKYVFAFNSDYRITNVVVYTVDGELTDDQRDIIYNLFPTTQQANLSVAGALA